MDQINEIIGFKVKFSNETFIESIDWMVKPQIFELTDVISTFLSSDYWQCSWNSIFISPKYSIAMISPHKR